jgi:hypothetical protein
MISTVRARCLLQLHGAAVEIRRRDFLEGTWAPFLLHAAALDVTYECVRRPPCALPSCFTQHLRPCLLLLLLNL